MSRLDPERTDRPTPAAEIYGEGGEITGYLADDVPIGSILDPIWDSIDQPLRVRTQWLRPRWTTPEELEDEDTLYLLFGDHELHGIDTSVYYEVAEEESAGAHLYVTLEVVRV